MPNFRRFGQLSFERYSFSDRRAEEALSRIFAKANSASVGFGQLVDGETDVIKLRVGITDTRLHEEHGWVLDANTWVSILK